MKYYDLHTHTTYSDGQATVEELVRAAETKGYGLGISDHLFCDGMDTAADIAGYLEALSSYSVLKGGEANIGEDWFLPDRIAGQFDYIIASVHRIPEENGTIRPLGGYFCVRSGYPADVSWENPFSMEKSENYLTALLPVIEHAMQTQRMDVYGHCTVLPFCEFLAGTAFLTDWEDELIALCKKYKVALEISGLWKEPGLAMVRRAKAAGLIFTMGSDCHLRKDLCNMDYAVRLSQEAGLTQDDFLYR